MGSRWSWGNIAASPDFRLNILYYQLKHCNLELNFKWNKLLSRSTLCNIEIRSWACGGGKYFLSKSLVFGCFSNSGITYKYYFAIVAQGPWLNLDVRNLSSCRLSIPRFQPLSRPSRDEVDSLYRRVSREHIHIGSRLRTDSDTVWFKIYPRKFLYGKCF